MISNEPNALLRNYSLTIQYDRINGYQLAGSEHRILQLLSDLVKQCPIFRRETIRGKLVHGVRKKNCPFWFTIWNKCYTLVIPMSRWITCKRRPVFLVSRGIKVSTKPDFFPGEVSNTPEYRMLTDFSRRDGLEIIQELPGMVHALIFDFQYF